MPGVWRKIRIPMGNLSLKETRTCSEIAKILYDFLPGSGSSTWKGHVSFATIAQKTGVGDFWQGGSKKPAIVNLLERTLELRRERFEPLMVEIIKSGLKYREKQGNSVKKEEITTISGLLLEIGFKISALWDEAFLRSLSSDGKTRASELVERENRIGTSQAVELSLSNQRLPELRDRFYELAKSHDRQTAGRELEDILNQVFELSGLKPRESFRVTGEQIDGSFELDNEVYLMEAKWEKAPLSEAPMLAFREKVAGKSAFTRGLFISLSRWTGEAIRSIVTGKQPNFFLMDGDDLSVILLDQFKLTDLLRAKLRHLAEEGKMFTSVRDIMSRESAKVQR